MPKNIKPMNLPLFYINLVLFLIPLVQEVLSKMARLRAKFIIFLMLFMLLLLALLLLLNSGGKLLLLPFTPSIGVLLPWFRIKLLMICCLVLLPPMTYLESLDVSIFVRPEKFQFMEKGQNRNFGYKIIISVKNTKFIL